MGEKLDPRQVGTFEELLRAMMFETEATRRILVRKGLLTNEEVLEEIKVVRREWGCWRGLVGLAGLEPAARGLGNLCSVHLSYRPMSISGGHLFRCCE